MNALLHLRAILHTALLSLLLVACEHSAVSPELEVDNVLLLEDMLSEATKLYTSDKSGGFEEAIEKFNFVLEHDSDNCFEDAYFYLANIYLSQENNESARQILIEGKKRYSELGDGRCILDIIQRFDLYLQNMSVDETLGKPIFIAYDHGPEPVGGLDAIQRNLEYPQEALVMGKEDTVVVQVSVNCFGHACLTRVNDNEHLGSMVMAARKAVKSVMWQPAMQRAEPVRVWTMVPVVFKLDE